MTATALGGLFDDLSFGGEWRRYLVARPLPDPEAPAPALLVRDVWV